MNKKCEEILKELESENKLKVWWDFEFPEKQELKLRLKDILEQNVDEKYYLKDYQIENILKSNFIQSKMRIQEKDYCDTLLARDWKDPKCVRVGGIFDKENSKHQAGSVYNENGLSPTLDCMAGGWRQPSIIIKNATKKGYLEAEEGDGIDISSRMQYHRGNVQKGMIQTLDCQGGNTKGVVIEGIKVIGNYMPSGHDASRIVDSDGLAPTVKENHGTVTAVVEKQRKDIKEIEKYCEYCGKQLQRKRFNGRADIGLRIRKLTPRETWRLMGFDDEDFEKAEKVNSNTQLYKQAGNSIVVNVLEKIFNNLLINNDCNKDKRGI